MDGGGRLSRIWAYAPDPCQHARGTAGQTDSKPFHHLHPSTGQTVDVIAWQVSAEAPG